MGEQSLAVSETESDRSLLLWQTRSGKHSWKIPLWWQRSSTTWPEPEPSQMEPWSDLTDAHAHTCGLHRLLHAHDSGWEQHLQLTMLWNGASGNNWSSLLLSGLNQTAAVDVLLVPVVSSDDPRAAGVPQTQHDNSLLSCISSGRLCVQPDGSCPTPGVYVFYHSALFASSISAEQPVSHSDIL